MKPQAVNRAAETLGAAGVLLLLVVLLALPALEIPWSLIDDATHSIERPRLMLQALHEGRWVGSLYDQPGVIVTEFEGGRFRPVGWLYFMITYALLGDAPALHHAWRFALLAITALCIFSAALSLSRSAVAAFLSALFAILFAPGLEGVYRLSPLELLLATLQAVGLAALALLYRRLRDGPRRAALNYALFVVALAAFTLAIGAKESALVFAAFLFGLLALSRIVEGFPSGRRWRRWLAPLAGVVLLGHVAFLALIAGNNVIGQGYAAQYGAGGVAVALRNGLWYGWTLLRNYGLFLIVGMAAFLARLWGTWRARRRLDERAYLQIACLLWCVAGVLFQSPFRALVERYIAPAALGLALFLGLEWGPLLTAPTRRRVLVRALAGVAAVLFLWETLASANATFQQLAARDTSSYQATQYLAGHVAPGGTVWVNLASDGEMGEFRHGIERVLRVVWQRPDIVVKALDEAGLEAYCAPGDWVALWAHAANIDSAAVQRRLGVRADLRAAYDHHTQRIWSPGAALEKALLEGPLQLPNRASQGTEVYDWHLLLIGN
ncbi:MAG: hypothetical protein Kow00120_22690 [Anaerolineae bacterium]